MSRARKTLARKLAREHARPRAERIIHGLDFRTRVAPKWRDTIAIMRTRGYLNRSAFAVLIRLFNRNR